MQHKSLAGVEIKDADQGKLSAVICTFNAVDHDKDVVLPGAFTEGQPVRLSAYNHGSWDDKLPIGKGAIRTTDTEAIFDGEFFLNTQAGRETFEVVKAMAALQEYSWGFDVLDAEAGTVDGESVQLIRKVNVHEVSPVLLGASIGTRTLAVKAKQWTSDIFARLRDAARERFGGSDTYVWVEDVDLDEGFVIVEVGSPTDTRQLRVPVMRGGDGSVALGSDAVEVEEVSTYVPKGWREAAPEGEAAPENLKLSEHVAVVAADVDGLKDRLADVMAKRAEKGKDLGEESAGAAAELADSLESAVKALREVLTSADADVEPEPEPDVGADEKALSLEDETRLTETLARFGLSL